MADLASSVDAHAENIRFLAYLYGEEARGEALIAEIEQHLARLSAITSRHPRDQRPARSCSKAVNRLPPRAAARWKTGYWRWRARNAAADAGVVGNKDVSLEALPDMNPGFIVVAEPDPSRPVLAPRLRSMSALASMPALRQDRLVIVKASLLNTLSHFNVAGAEALARAFYPGQTP